MCEKRLIIKLPHISKDICVVGSDALDAILEEARNMMETEPPGTKMVIEVAHYTEDEIASMPEFEGW